MSQTAPPHPNFLPACPFTVKSLPYPQVLEITNLIPVLIILPFLEGCRKLCSAYCLVSGFLV